LQLLLALLLDREQEEILQTVLLDSLEALVEHLH
jgi:hypothetical protein